MFTEGRSVEFNDWIADTCGAFVASILYLKWRRYRQILEMRLFGSKDHLGPIEPKGR